MKASSYASLALLTAVACGGPSSTDEAVPPGEPTPAETGTETDPAAPPTEAAPAPTDGDPPYIDDAELATLGFRVEPLEGDDARLCQGDGCICRTALDSDMTLEENLRVFRDALAHGQGEGAQRRTVDCVTAEVGRCGDFRYFLYVGDVYRHEIRWFDADGAMVAWRNVTDYDAFCGGSLARWKGRVPRCDEVVETELICGESQDVLTPIEDLRALTAGLGPPGSGP